MSSRPQYLFKRSGSDNYYLRLQPPGRKVIERSLGTPDLKLAEIAAMPLIREHKAFMYQRRPTVTPFWHRAYEPGLRMIGGEQVIATDRELQYLDASGNVIRREPNGSPAELLSPAPLSGVPSFKAYDEAKRVAAPAKNGDEALLDLYITQGSVKTRKPLSDARAKEARAIYRTFKSFADKPLAKCTLADGRAFVAHLIEQAGGVDKIKSATLHRNLVPLVAMVARAISEGKLTCNPFVGCVPNRDDSEDREGFSDADVDLIRVNLHKLDKHDQLLVRLVASTGMDRGEAFSIAGERIENGIRYCLIGTKTEARPRPIPFPEIVLEHLPEKITGPLFTGRKDSASKRVTKFLEGIGVKGVDSDGRTLAPFHSFRHRAATKLRQAKVEPELRYAIGGWKDGNKPNSGWKYGDWPMPDLKEAIDKIGGL
jgi:integrase